MTIPLTLGPGLLYFTFEDPDNAGTYLDPCGLEEWTANFQSEITNDTVYDCDPTASALAVILRHKLSTSCSVQATGKLASTSLGLYRSLHAQKASAAARLIVGTTGANGGGHWAGNWLLENFEIKGNRTNVATVSLTIGNDGAFPWTDAA